MREDINGVPAGDAKTLYDIVEEACASVLVRDPREAFDAALGLDVQIGTEWNDAGCTMTYHAPKKIFRSADDLRASLEKRTHEARVVAFPILAALDPDAAAPLFQRSLPLDLSSSYQMSFEGNVYRAMWLRYQELGKRLPAETFAELMIAGRFEMSGLSDAQVAAIPYERFVESIISDEAPYPSDGDAQRFIDLHPALATIGARGALAERIASYSGHFARDLFPRLMSQLVRERHPSATPAALAYLARTGAEYGNALGWILALRHLPTMTKYAMELADRIAALGAIAWDPHHAAASIVPGIRCAYALDPSTASARLGAWFDPARVANDAGSKVAWDIWMIGEGKLVSHDGTNLATGDRPMVASDPEWGPIAAKLVHHPRLGKAAKWVCDLVAKDAKEAKAMIAEHAIPAGEWTGFAKPGAKKKAPAKAAKSPPKPAAKKTKKR